MTIRELADVSHRRYNPLLDEWVLCSPRRLSRPWQGQSEAAEPEERRSYDPECYLCPGNARANRERNPQYASTFAFDNDFAALTPNLPAFEESEGDLLRVQPESGVCRVLCFSPRHDLTLARMEHEAVRAVVDAWISEVRRLLALDGIRHVQIFENKGAMMGSSNPHPHGQIWATTHIPSGPARRLAGQRAYWRRHGRDLLGDYLAREIAEAERVVCRNDHWSALVPFWATWPYETLLIPSRHIRELPDLSPAEADALADVMIRLNRRYDNLFGCSFPYSMGWHAQPPGDGPHEYWRLHASYCPPLLRSATVRKFSVGYELAAEPQRDFTPEQAAAALRASAETLGGA